MGDGCAGPLKASMRLVQASQASWSASLRALAACSAAMRRRAVGWGKPLRFEAPLKRITKLVVSSREFHVLLTVLNCLDAPPNI